MPGNANGSLDGIALKPLTVAFHEAAFIATLQAENQQPFWSMMSGEQKQQAGNPMGPANPQALNRYSYVQNNPLRWTDPSGHWVFSIGFSIGAGSRIGGSLSGGMTIDEHGNVRLYGDSATGITIGDSAGIGVTVTVLPVLDHVDQTAGAGYVAGVNTPLMTGEFVFVGDEVMSAKLTGGSVTLGKSVGTDVHLHRTDTALVSVGDLATDYVLAPMAQHYRDAWQPERDALPNAARCVLGSCP